MVCDTLTPRTPSWHRFPSEGELLRRTAQGVQLTLALCWMGCPAHLFSSVSYVGMGRKYSRHLPALPLCKSKAGIPVGSQPTFPTRSREPLLIRVSTWAETSPVAAFSLQSGPWGPLESKSLLRFWGLDGKARKSSFLKCGKMRQQFHQVSLSSFCQWSGARISNSVCGSGWRSLTWDAALWQRLIRFPRNTEA